MILSSEIDLHQTIEQRLARWLLLCHDRIDGDDIYLTLEFLSMMLGVRRGGVTEALIALQKRGFINVLEANRHERL